MSEKLKQTKVTTVNTRQSNSAPRLPHEHDESADSQTSGRRATMIQAHRDIERGLVDTDRRNQRGVESVKQN